LDFVGDYSIALKLLVKIAASGKFKGNFSENSDSSVVNFLFEFILLIARKIISNRKSDWQTIN
jgi:hypothetical protein